jgi:hypothetical protein
MFQDLDSTLKKILDDAAMTLPPLAPPLSELLNAEISFITPDKTFSTADPKPAVNLFLYDVKENRELRDPSPIIEKTGNGFKRRQPPVRLDCSYIVTAWSKLTNEQQVVEEHRLLAEALLWLTRFPTIPDRYLQGTLRNQLYPPQMWVAQIDPNKNAGEFWDALDVPPRAAFYLTVTIAMELGLQDTGTLVTTRFTGVAPGETGAAETMIQIGGRVLGPEVTAVRIQANLANAALNQATLAAAANFVRGDVVLLEQGANTEPATVATVSGLTITFEANLANTFTGGSIRIADLVPGTRSIRVTDTKGIATGVSVRISQAMTVEERNVEQVDRTRNVLTLSSALTNTYAMRAAAQPVKIAGTVAAAIVNLVDAGLRTESARDGRFTFPRVSAGNHVIEVLAIGFQPKTQPLVVPSLAEDYEITLTPLP